MTRFWRSYLPLACWVCALGAFMAFASTARLVWSWRDSWDHAATLGVWIAIVCFLLGALFLWLAIHQPWRKERETRPR